PVHLEFFDSVEAIATAKAEVLEGLAPGGVAVLNADDPLVRKIREAHRGKVLWFGRDRRYEVSAENWRGTVHGMRFDLRLGGRGGWASSAACSSWVRPDPSCIRGRGSASAPGCRPSSPAAPSPRTWWPARGGRG